MSDKKSILDDFPVNDKAFPLKEGGVKNDLDYVVVGNCTNCGSPIYGPWHLPSVKAPHVLIKYSCDCKRPDSKGFQDTIRAT